MTDDRSERLRKRRKRSNRQSAREEPQANSAASAAQSAADESDDSEDGNGGAAATQTGSVKEERVGTYMYLPESQLKDLKRRYNVLKAEYEFEYDEEFEKNRHFYPLVVQHGLDSLESMDVSEIRESLEHMG